MGRELDADPLEGGTRSAGVAEGLCWGRSSFWNVQTSRHSLTIFEKWEELVQRPHHPTCHEPKPHADPRQCELIQNKVSACQSQTRPRQACEEQETTPRVSEACKDLVSRKAQETGEGKAKGHAERWHSEDRVGE